MKKVAVLLLFCTTFSLFAQKPNLQVGESFYKVGLSGFMLLGSGKTMNGDYYSTILQASLFSKPKLIFLGYDKNLKETSENTIEIEDLVPTPKDKGIKNFQSCFYWNDSLYTLIAVTNRKEETKDLYVLSSFQNQSKLSKPRKLASLTEVKTKLIATSVADAMNYIFKITYSSDSSKVLISYLYDKGPREAQTMFMQVWGAGFETMLWEKEIEIPFNRASSVFNSIHLDNNANTYLMFNVTDSKRKGIFSKFKYDLMRISNFGEVVDNSTIDLGTNIAKDLHISFDSNGDMLGTSYYYKGNALLGVCLLRYPLNVKELPPLSFHAFEEDIDADRKRDPRFTKFMRSFDGKTDLNYVLQYTIPESNGDITLIGEDRYITYPGSIGVGNGAVRLSVSGQQVEPQYHFDDVIVTRINKDGKILWTEHIPKRQVFEYEATQYTSYSYLRRGTDIIIIYNDHADNSWDNEVIKSFPTRKAKSVLAVATITDKGVAKREVISNFKEDDLWTMSRAVKQLDKNEASIGIYKDGQYGLGRISWK